MKYEEKLVTSEHSSTLLIKGTNIWVINILRMLEEGKTMDEVIKDHPELSTSDISACLEYATELVIVSDFKKSTKIINEHFRERHALANRIRTLKDKPFIFKDKNGNEIDLSKL
jgi:uncharacterized protein (DUF433 family)